MSASSHAPKSHSIPPGYYTLTAELPTRGNRPDIFTVADKFATACTAAGLHIDRGVASTRRPISEFSLPSVGVHREELSKVMERVSKQTGHSLFVAPSRPLDTPFEQSLLHSKNPVGRAKRHAVVKSKPESF